MSDQTLAGSSAPPVTIDGPATAPSRSTATRILSSDRSSSAGLDLNPALAPVAELIAHQGAEAPFTVGLLGPAGSGKTAALNQLMDRVAGLAKAARRAGGSSPFVARVLSVRVTAPEIDHDPAGGLAAAIYRALATASDDPASVALAASAVDSVRDPQTVAREAGDRLLESRRRLDAERQALADLEGRRARLSETVLFGQSGSKIDAYARANRGVVEARLRTFGFTEGEPLATYKSLVRDVAERNSFGGRIAVFTRAMGGFRGQARLLVVAILLGLLAWGLDYAQIHQASWLAWLHAQQSDATVGIVNWIEAHTNWLSSLRLAAIGLAVLALLLNLWRAARFTGPVVRGAGLLSQDLQSRRADLDAMIAQQNRRSAALASDVERFAQQAEHAEKRATTRSSADRVSVDVPFGSGDGKTLLAEQFLRTVGGEPQGPARIVIGLDDLDALPPDRAAALVSSLRRWLGQGRYVTILAADPALLQGDAGVDHLAAAINIPVRLATAEQAGADRLLRFWFGQEQSPPAGEPEATRSRLDEPLSGSETDLMTAMAPLAGASPRALKRFANLYRLIRTETKDRSALALALAVDIGGTGAERSAVDVFARSGSTDAAQAFDASPRLQAATSAVAQAEGRPLTSEELHRAQALVATYSLRG